MGVANLALAVSAPAIQPALGPVELAARGIQAIVTGVGAVTATVNIEVSNDNVNFLVLATITLSGTTSATDGFASQAQWNFVRANVTAISGTSAAVTVLMSL